MPNPPLLEKAFDRSKTNVKVEKNGKTTNTGFVGSTEYSSLPGCGNSRRNLTEAEKGERRMRRILANRESARQTIRRRQALCEDLTKKAADLASENGSLKREVEMAINEYQMLENTNKELKDQMAKVEITEAEETQRVHNPESVHVPQPLASPLFLYNHPPFPPIFWPPEKEKPPFYVVPYPWYFQSQPSTSLQKNDQDVMSTTTTPHLFMPAKVKTEPSIRSEAKITDDLNEPPEDRGDQQQRHPGTYLDKPSVKPENITEKSSDQRERYCEPIVFSFKKSAEAEAAAEARKRRRELTKLKNLHGRQCRMHC